MSENNISRSTTTGLKSAVSDYSVASQTIDEPNSDGETYWNNDEWAQNLGYYKSIPELKKAVDAIAMWTCGKGWNANAQDKIDLEHVKGWGEDTIDSIFINMIVTKKINGDAYAEIIRDPDTKVLLNLKPLNPLHIRHVVNKKGIITAYEEMDTISKKAKRRFKTDDILHLCNDRIANEIHGTSVIEACKWVIDARNEAMSDWRRILHRSTIRVLYVDVEDSTKINTLKTQYAEAVKQGEVLILPVKKGEAELADYTAPPIAVFLEWIRYLENFFYQAVGIPKVILGGSQDYTEASSKVGYLTFEQPYMTEQRLLEQDIYKQLGIKIKFNRPTSLKEDMQQSEAANTGQLGFQPNEMSAQMGRVE